jgi:glutamine amidotransferase
MIAIIDYGAGNLRSVVNAIHYLGYQPKITRNPADLAHAQAIILPGVGAAADTIKNLRQQQLIEPIHQCLHDGKYFLGICVGMQILLTSTEEGSWSACLNIIPGEVKRLPEGLKIPHMGWNQVKQASRHLIYNDIPDETNFYFVHSYYVDPSDRSLVIGETDYGITFCSVIAKDNMVATQFHPEKSGQYGLKMYDNFLKMAYGQLT